MPSTTYGLPYPAAGDPPAGHTQIQALAQALNPEAWTDATLLNSWGTIGPWFPPGYYKSNGIVRLRGNALGGSVNAAVFTLPSGYRPAATVEFGCIAQSGDVGRVQVTSGGSVIQVVTTVTSLAFDVISFRI
jgi:hypothetical protein